MDKNFNTLYPFKRNSFDLESGHRMNYVDEGEGTAIVMVHGNPTWSFYYRNLVLGLRDKFRCIVPDHLGCGFSEKPQDYDYTLTNHINNLSALIRSLDLKRFHLVVHDWGGPIGIGMAESFLERLDKVVILNTSAFNSKRIPLRIRACRIPVFGTVAIQGFNAFAGLATSMAVKKRMKPEIKKGYILPYDNWKNRIATLRFVQDIPVSPRELTYKRVKSIEDKLPLLKDKAMRIFWGGKDFCFNDSFYKEWVKRFPDAEAIYYPDAGHYVLEDEGEAILETLQGWL